MVYRGKENLCPCPNFYRPFLQESCILLLSSQDSILFSGMYENARSMLQVHNLGLFITVNSHCKVSGLLKPKRQYEWRSLSYDGTFLSRWCHFFYNENVLIYRVREIPKCKMMCTINYTFIVSWSHPSWTPMEKPRGIMWSILKNKIKEL